MVTIGEFLNRKNPDIDNSNTLSGPNTVSANYSHVNKAEDWEEINDKTLRNLYGEILDLAIPNPPPYQIPTELETEICNERQLKLIIFQYILGPVRFALGLAYRYCEKSWKHNPDGEFNSSIDPGAGGRAKRPKESDNTRFRPDWSCVRKGYMTSTVMRSYFNYCPGDTKIPAEQVQTYSGDHWDVRYTWIITEGVTLFLIIKEGTNPGLAITRESRVLAAPITPDHGRVASSDTDISSLMAPLSITTHSYREDHPNVEYQSVKIRFIPWSGTERGLNAKKALFLLFMLARAPGGPKLIQTDYPPLDSWWREGEMFQHNSTGQVKKHLPPNAVLCQPSGQPISTANIVKGPDQTDIVTPGETQLTRSTVEAMKWSEEHEMYYYWDGGNQAH